MKKRKETHGLPKFHKLRATKPFNLNFTHSNSANLGAWKKILHFTENAATLPEKVKNVTFDFGGSMRFLWKVELYLPVRKFYTRKVSEDCSCNDAKESWPLVSHACYASLSENFMSGYAKLEAGNQIKPPLLTKHCKNGKVASFTLNFSHLRNFNDIPVNNFTLYLKDVVSVD